MKVWEAMNDIRNKCGFRLYDEFYHMNRSCPTEEIYSRIRHFAMCNDGDEYDDDRCRACLSQTCMAVEDQYGKVRYIDPTARDFGEPPIQFEELMGW